MDEKVRERLVRILQCIDAIDRYAAGADQTAYESNPMLRDAVLWNLMALSEAATQISGIEESAVFGISHANRIKGLRVVLVHRHEAIDHRIIWPIVTTHLPVLRQEVEALLNAEAQ